MHTIRTNYTEAVNSMDSENWILAMQKELDSLVENNTLEWQKAPRNENTVSGKLFLWRKSWV